MHVLHCDATILVFGELAMRSRQTLTIIHIPSGMAILCMKSSTYHMLCNLYLYGLKVWVPFKFRSWDGYIHPSTR